jgi:hypothetical protein
MDVDSELGSFFAEIDEIAVTDSSPVVVTEVTTVLDKPRLDWTEESIQPATETHNVQPSSATTVSVTVASAPAVVFSKPPISSSTSSSSNATHASHSIYSYEEAQHVLASYDLKSTNPYPTTTTAITAAPMPPTTPYVAPIIPRSDKKFVRKAAEEVWVDDTLQEWPENDFRIFVGDLAKEITSELLSRAFQHFPSFAMAKVIRNKADQKSKGYGFVSFLEPMDCIKAMREMNGKYLGTRSDRFHRYTD